MSITIDLDPGELAPAIERRLDEWQSADVGRRIWDRDPTVWFDPPRPETADRLGWLDAPEPITPATIEAFAGTVAGEDVRSVVLLGMGGSSLSPRVYAAIAGASPGFPGLIVLDSTHPDAVAGVEESIDPSRTIFLVASKSGTTLETLSLFRFFWAKVTTTTREPGDRFVAITDPDTPLDRLAVERGFRAVFHTPPDVGGRYSALTAFGLVPAALMGVDLRAVLEAARSAREACGPDVPVGDNPALRLGAAIGELALAGRDKVLLATPTGAEPLADWTEQLVAESLGKDGRGVVPVPRFTDPTGPDRWLLTAGGTGDGSPRARLGLRFPVDLGAAFFLLEMAVAAAGAVIGVNPFDQPDVQAAKTLARRAMEGSGDGLDVAEHTLDEPGLPGVLAGLFDAAPPRYGAIHAYLAPSPETDALLEALRADIEAATGMVTTVGYGPRFLHSTGQLHKGGPPTGVFLQIVDHPRAHLSVPETDYSFGRIIAAQAAGDQAALRARGRDVAMVCLGDDGPPALARLREILALALSRPGRG